MKKILFKRKFLYVSLILCFFLLGAKGKQQEYLHSSAGSPMDNIVGTYEIYEVGKPDLLIEDFLNEVELRLKYDAKVTINEDKTLSLFVRDGSLTCQGSFVIEESVLSYTSNSCDKDFPGFEGLELEINFSDVQNFNVFKAATAIWLMHGDAVPPKLMVFKRVP